MLLIIQEVRISYEIYWSGGVFHSDPNHVILVLNWITIRIQEFFKPHLYHCEKGHSGELKENKMK